MAWLPIESLRKNILIRMAKGNLSKPLSPEGLESWSDLYTWEESDEVSYDELATANDLFFQIMTQHGAPDVGNPWAQGEATHYLFHPKGFIATEVSRILSCADDAISDIKRENAKSRIGILLHAGCEFISLQGAFSSEDAEFATTIAIAEGEWERFGARHSTVITSAVKHRLINPMMAPGLIISRIFAEDDKYPSPWKMIIDCFIKWRDKAFNKRPPKIDLTDFRARKKAQLEQKQNEAGSCGQTGDTNYGGGASAPSSPDGSGDIAR